MTVVGNRLSDMEFDEVSLVNRPANQLSKVVLFKSDGPNPLEEVEKMPGHDGKKKKYDEEEEMTSKDMHGDEKDDEEEDDESMKDRMARLRNMQKSDEAVDLPGEVYEYIESLEAANAEMMDELTKMAEFVADEETELLKSADPAIIEIVKAAEERAAAAEQIAKAERDFRLEREFVAKAAEFEHLSFDAEEFGPVLKAAAEVLEDNAWDALLGVLSAANEALGESSLFNEIGKASSFDNDTSLGSIEKAAARLREADSSLSHAQAVAKAVELEPSLYTDHLRGN
jgi:hypothetical protein